MGALSEANTRIDESLERRRADLGGHLSAPEADGLLIDLARRMSRAADFVEAAVALLEAAERLRDWSAAAFLEFDAKGSGRVYPVLVCERRNGVRTDSVPPRRSRPVNAAERRAIAEGAAILDPDGGEPEGHCSMIVPVRTGSRTVAIATLQCRHDGLLDASALRDMQFLADYCGGAFDRIAAEQELRVQQRTTRLFADLGRRLALASTRLDAVRTIFEAADAMVGWDACALNVYDPESGMLHGILTVDTIDGERRDFAHEFVRHAPGPLAREVLFGGPRIVLRDPAAPSAEGLVPFGNVDRPSLSLMFTPIRAGHRTVGFLTIQSYAPCAYSEDDLDSLQALADHCGAAFSRILAESELREAKAELEGRIEERTRELQESNELLREEAERRRRAQADLAASHENYRRAIENASGVPYRLDYGTRLYEFIGTGTKEILGIDAEVVTADMVGERVRRVQILDPDAPQDFAAYREAFHRGEVARWQTDLLLDMGDGTLRWINDCSVPVHDAAGKVVGSLGILQDVTVRKLAEEAARREREEEMRDLQEQNAILRRHIRSTGVQNPEFFAEMPTASPAMHVIFQYVESVAPSDKTLLIQGDTGVGKELLARSVHRASGRRGRFVPVNVAGIDSEALADTLFGHTRGAFTGADAEREGLVAAAANGTLFLDEIGDLCPTGQVKLLRLLQEREYYPLGADRPRRSEARIVAATNQELEKCVHEGRFRKDLYYRLQTHCVHVPALAERPEDIPILVEHFVEQAAKAIGRRRPAVPRELRTLLASYPFPGNVRELQALCFDAVVRSPGNTLSTKPFAARIGEQLRSRSGGTRIARSEGDEAGFGAWLPTIREATQRLVDEAMRRSEGNQTQAARLLGITQQSLSERIKRRAAASRRNSPGTAPK